MLRDVPFDLDRAEARHVFMTATGVSDHARTPADEDESFGVSNQTYTNDALDDVFGSAPSSPLVQSLDSTSAEEISTLPSASILTPMDSSANAIVTAGNKSGSRAEPSDIPRLRSIHVTNGYREGVAASKELHLQSGFDEGYTLGAMLGLCAGWCLGVLRGVHDSLGTPGTDSERERLHTVRSVLVQAEEGLSTRALFSAEYFGQDGIWTFPVTNIVSSGVPEDERGDGEADEEGREEAEVTFRHVAAAHPLIQQWTSKVRDLARDHGLNICESGSQPNELAKQG